MIFYSYDENGFYAGEVLGQKNPAFGELEQPEFLQPAKTTSIAPPNAEINKIAKFINDSWIIVDDPKFLLEQEEKEKLAIIEQQIKEQLAQQATQESIRLQKIQSIKQKLNLLGLTEDEISVLIGG